MTKLAAKFQVDTPAPLLIKRPKCEPLRLTANVREFRTTLQLTPDCSQGQRLEDEMLWSYLVTRVDVTVERDEVAAPPPALIRDDGTRDYSPRAPYFGDRLPQYRDAALEILNRAIAFFRYKLRNPLLYPLALTLPHLDDPLWFGDDGESLEAGVHEFRVQLIPGLDRFPFGAQQLTPDRDEELQLALSHPVEPALYEEILSDAQAAIFRGNLRRAVLEMAIACEVAVKQTFFAGSTISVRAYEYLEDTRRLSVPVIELIDGVSKYAVGQSFRDLNQTAFRHIDHLFRCRNKVAHRGVLTYRDDGAKWHNVDRQTLEEWWVALDQLLGWLRGLVV